MPYQYKGGCGRPFITNNSASVSLSGDGTYCYPFTADLNLSATSGNTLVILEDGVYASGATFVSTTVKAVDFICGSGAGVPVNGDSSFVFNGSAVVDLRGATLLFFGIEGIMYSKLARDGVTSYTFDPDTGEITFSDGGFSDASLYNLLYQS